jgi:hypothetical protein
METQSNDATFANPNATLKEINVAAKERALVKLDAPREKLSELVAKDVTYNGAFQVDKRTGGTGKAVGAVSYVAAKMNLSVTKDTTIAELRKNYDKDTIKSHLVALKSAKVLRTVHSRQVWALIGQDQNYTLTVKGKVNKKGEFTGFSGNARFLKPEAAKKMSKDATIAFLQSKLAAAGIAV